MKKDIDCVKAELTDDNDLSKREDTKGVIEGMLKALNRHEIDTMDRYFSKSFSWIGNTGCGVKKGLKSFQDGWQRPFQTCFSDKYATDQARLIDGEWSAAFGYQMAKHTGTFMGIKPTGKELMIKYMDFWKVKDGKIIDNYVMVDFPHVLAQLGIDCFDGKGWDSYTEGYDCENEKN